MHLEWRFQISDFISGILTIALILIILVGICIIQARRVWIDRRDSKKEIQFYILMASILFIPVLAIGYSIIILLPIIQ